MSLLRGPDGRIQGFQAFPRLETERLVLREISSEDASFWLQHFNDPEVEELTAFEGSGDLEAAKAEIRRYCAEPFEQGHGIRWGLELREEPQLIGTCGFYAWEREVANRARMGYDLLRAYRGRGFMSEAFGAILRYGFETMELHRIEVHVDPRNGPSLRLLERFGFVREGLLRESSLFRGTFQDDIVLSLLRGEWDAERLPPPRQGS